MLRLQEKSSGKSLTVRAANSIHESNLPACWATLYILSRLDERARPPGQAGATRDVKYRLEWVDYGVFYFAGSPPTRSGIKTAVGRFTAA
jgi:hypothetical protein